MITSKSLHHSNVAFVLPESGFVAPDNNEFGVLFGGKDATGARFIDDSVIHTKALTLPAVQLKVVLEGKRLRIEDETGTEPSSSRLIKEAHRICQTLFPNMRLEGFGFNFDLYYRFNRLLSITAAVEHFFGAQALASADLRDFGFQFTLERGGKETDIYFLKVTAPLEVAVHMNRHFASQTLPSDKQLQALFETCYNSIDTTVAELKA